LALLKTQCQLSVTGVAASEAIQITPVGEQFIQSARIDHRAREDMRPDLRPFSSTQTARSGASCFSRMAQDRPAGPPPTTTTS
jgi:nicotinamide mononucleotide (NMN) deamidase PncC